MPLLLPLLLFAAAAAPYDLVIRNGHVIDGTGSPWYAADIGIREVDEKLPPSGIAVNVEEFGKDGVVYEKDSVKVTAFEVDHGRFRGAIDWRPSMIRMICSSGKTPP